MSFRQYSFIDQCISEVDHLFKSVFMEAKHNTRTSPAEALAEGELDHTEKSHVAGLMRVDHTGEVCAQALYRGQAFVAKDKATKAHLYHAADEEYDHLSWCEQRLTELDAKKSLLNPLWYIGSFTIGAAAGLISDKVSYGFVAETEKQVMNHLSEHLSSLPVQDEKSKAILQAMYEDEKSHAKEAVLAGGMELPFPVKMLMTLKSKVMTTIAYKL